METLNYSYPAGNPVDKKIIVGVVASGDLEVLLEPAAANTTSVHVTTSVTGKGKIWAEVLNRIFANTPLPAARIDINDCGATPGVVRLRIEQAYEELKDSKKQGDGHE